MSEKPDQPPEELGTKFDPILQGNNPTDTDAVESSPAVPKTTFPSEGVGYGRPPLHSRFKPGRSGNPSGKRKHRNDSLDLRFILSEALSSKISVTSNGRIQRRPIIEVAIQRLLLSVAKGDTKAWSALLRLAKEFPPILGDRDSAGHQVDYGAEVRAKLEQMAQRISQGSLQGPGT
jgi:hypothetical protein